MIDKSIVEHIANLARIEINEEEKKFLGEQLSKILDYIDKLKELKVEDIEPTRGTFFEENVLREDISCPSENFKEILKNACHLTQNHFKIPKVIE
jgi:aspartyl-tRNA(Asn)/glutamyl-tRNA(Gln) amidotransferase subunit C